MDEAKKFFNETEDYVINSITEYMEFVGAQTTMGRIFGLLLTKSDPMSLSEITIKLGLSKPSISNSLKSGLAINMFRKVYKPEAPREDFYTMSDDFVELMLDPGLAKLDMLNKKFAEIIKKMDKNKEMIDADPELSKLYNKLKYHYLSFEILIDEYQELCKRLNTKLKDLKKQYKDLNL